MLHNSLKVFFHWYLTELQIGPRLAVQPWSKQDFSNLIFSLLPGSAASSDLCCNAFESEGADSTERRHLSEFFWHCQHISCRCAALNDNQKSLLQLAFLPREHDALVWLLPWRRGCLCGCLCVCHVDVLCPNDWLDHVRHSPDCSPAILVFPHQIWTR